MKSSCSQFVKAIEVEKPCAKGDSVTVELTFTNTHDDLVYSHRLWWSKLILDLRSFAGQCPHFLELCSINVPLYDIDHILDFNMMTTGLNFIKFQLAGSINLRPGWWVTLSRCPVLWSRRWGRRAVSQPSWRRLAGSYLPSHRYLPTLKARPLKKY